MNNKNVIIFLMLLWSMSSNAQYMNVTFCAATDEVTPVKDANNNDQRHKGAMILDYIKVKRFGGASAPTIYQLSKEPGDPVFSDGTFLDECTNNNNNTNCSGCGTCVPPRVNGTNTGSISTKYEESVRVRGLDGNLRFESTGIFNQVCYTTKNIDLTNYKRNSLSIEVGWEGLKQDGFSARNILIYYTFNGGNRNWLKIINSSRLVLGKNSTSLSKTIPVPTTGGNGGGGGCSETFNFGIQDFNNQAQGIQFPVRMVSEINGQPSYNISYKNGSYSYSCEFSLPSNKSNYFIEPKYNVDAIDKVSTRDLVVLLRHILGKTIFTKPEMKIAADVNFSGTVSTSDIATTRKVILGRWDEYKKVDAYRFWNADQDFSGNTAPYKVPPIQQKVRLSDVLNKSVSGNFKVVKMGDLTTIQNLQGGVDTRNEKVLTLECDDQILQKGKSYTINFILNNDEISAINGLQGSFISPNQSIEFRELKWANDMDNDLYYYLKTPNDCRFLWYTDQAITLPNAHTIRLSIYVNEDTKLSDALLWNDAQIQGLYVDNNIREGQLKLSIRKKTINTFTSNSVVIAPNPVIGYNIVLRIDQPALISHVNLVNLQGENILNWSNMAWKENKGEILLPITSTPISGIYFLVLNSADGSKITKKIMLQ